MNNSNIHVGDEIMKISLKDQIHDFNDFNEFWVLVLVYVPSLSILCRTSIVLYSVVTNNLSGLIKI